MTKQNLTAEIGILGGGIAGLSLAYFLDEPAAILEKNRRVGGLCRSFQKKGIAYDIGPHIIFSKNKEVLDFMNSISDNQQHRRSNQIFHQGKFIKYPFENHLAQLGDKNEIDYCLNSFLNNPYENMPADNMLAFFLKTFGEGITRTYLQPYNEKIWKFDPAMMDTQMVERIPKPPPGHIIRSAKGNYSEGYTHQLYFSYPKKGGMQSVVDGVCQALVQKETLILRGTAIRKIKKQGDRWLVLTKDQELQFARLVNCMPIHELIKVLENVPAAIEQAVKNLKYNSIYIIIVNVKQDTIGDNFAVMLPQKDVLFHRLSKLDFMGGNYHLKNSTTFMLDVTFRQGDLISQIKKPALIRRCIDDLIKLSFIKGRQAVNFTDIKKEKYAYVIYDLEHRKNTDTVLQYLRSLGIESTGRSAEFEYLNSDQVIEHSLALAKKINTRA